LEWTVSSSARACGACGRPFAEREEYWSALFGTQEGFQRRDFCDACWRDDMEGTFSRWRTRSKKKPAPPRRFVNDEVLLDFFERLCDTADPSKAKLQFIMAVLLLRKRLLRERARRVEGGRTVWTVEAAKLGKSFEVRDQGLSEPEIAELLMEIGQVLNIDLGGRSTAGAGEAPGEQPEPAK
jgi:hypothetical protein